MMLRTTALATFAVAAGRKLIAMGIRFLRNEPASEHERRMFVHANGLAEAVVNQFLNRTFAPTHLQVVH